MRPTFEEMPNRYLARQLAEVHAELFKLTIYTNRELFGYEKLRVEELREKSKNISQQMDDFHSRQRTAVS